MAQAMTGSCVTEKIIKWIVPTGYRKEQKMKKVTVDTFGEEYPEPEKAMRPFPGTHPS